MRIGEVASHLSAHHDMTMTRRSGDLPQRKVVIMIYLAALIVCILIALASITLMTDTPKLNVSFLIDDVRNQAQQSKEIIAHVKTLHEIAGKIQDLEIRKQIESTGLSLLQVANALMNNVVATSNTANAAIMSGALQTTPLTLRTNAK